MAKGKSRGEKPTGRKEIVLLGGGRSPEVRRVQWPKQKEEVEQLMLRGALRSPARGPPVLAELYRLERPPRKNPEDHFDFTLLTKRGNEHLDLVEFAPLSRHGGSYEEGNTRHIRAERVDLFWETITAKARKYGSSATPLHLLVYSTDFRLAADEETLLLVALRASRESHPFTSIAYYCPDDLTSGEVFVIYPADRERLESVDEQEMRNRQIAIADLSGGMVVPGEEINLFTPPKPGERRGLISGIQLEVPLPRAGQPSVSERQVRARSGRQQDGT